MDATSNLAMEEEEGGCTGATTRRLNTLLTSKLCLEEEEKSREVRLEKESRVIVSCERRGDKSSDNRLDSMDDLSSKYSGMGAT